MHSIDTMMPNADSTTPQSSFFHVRNLEDFLEELAHHGFGVSSEDEEAPFKDFYGELFALALSFREDGAIAVGVFDERLFGLDTDEVSAFGTHNQFSGKKKDFSRPWRRGLEEIVAAHIVDGGYATLIDPMTGSAWGIVSHRTRAVELVDAGFDLARKMLE